MANSESDVERWRKHSGGTNRLKLLWKRQTAVRALREHLFDEGFLEIQSPLLVRGTTPDPAIDSVSVGDRFLVTSTEYQLKRLEVGGIEKLYSLTQNFRAGEVSPRHNPEFTMLEWARVGGSLERIEKDAQAMVRRAYQALHPDGEPLRLFGRPVEIDGREWERLTVREAFDRHLGLKVDPDFSLESLCRSKDLPVTFRSDRALAFSYLLDLAGSRLGNPVPIFLCEWPAFATSSAALVDGSDEVAQRSELFIAGLEIADGFPSLQGRGLQEELFEKAQVARKREGKGRVELDRRYLDALSEGMPAGAGMALGVDRLAMVLTEQEEIRNVLAFAWDEL